MAKFWHLDVSDEKEVEKVYNEVVKEFGKLDATVNNAGIAGADKPTHELTEKEWDAVMNVNVKGILYLVSEESKFVTGSELVIDGGYTCK